MTVTQRVMVANHESLFFGRLGEVVRVSGSTLIVKIDGYSPPLPFDRTEVVHAPAGNKSGDSVSPLPHR